ncbi:methionine--tRNA ligase [Candidatus Nomurabacteria bacterium RIFCSPLOWO2_01_FULL_41_12]|uniref:Methionine--tRNA ligase n=1 Tax=Candidatus Nomurabacteria bacterium RIFCSPLOWO2_01_FULL_41_12 TaxID=1801774 RepID=A0A1F6WVY5_9BACT|nr:MAG: methionine--tRNA ligase [Candidatus Nomurabacteria bacterium RIFCSPHIGHO2_01_FULL_40_10]OGI86029.1 MAG: methionine--tRNA ligase [Candidatus Nomurabacteria bacterium RIFCSPLOWO2_01_FULL_41_12]
MDKKSFYITTTIPYVNAEPHIGFALELVQSDAIARYQRLQGHDVFFSTGTDEHGQKIWEASVQEGKDIQEYVDHYAQKFMELKEALNLSYDNFIRTTSKEHIIAAQEFWHLCDKKGDIYKKVYRGLYCVGCEKFITEKDLMEGRCALHPTKVPEIVEEENYFFRLGNYKKQLLEYLSSEKAIIPQWRRKEAIDFVKDGMEDFSISRDKKRFSWGIPIPGDDTQVMYVWFDALVNYISSLGWPHSRGAYEKFWENGETVQIAGKDMVKFQSVMWQGMLMSAGMATTDTIVYHGFITGEGGIKMSKSVGNVINPNDIVQEYGTDALRYFLLREISPFEDSPFTMERFKEAYNANLANGLGNLASRILTLSEKYLEECPEIPEKLVPKEFYNLMESFDIKKAVDFIWSKISELDKSIQDNEPFKVVKIDAAKGKELIRKAVLELYTIARMLNSIMPETNVLLKKLIKENKKPETSLFPRKE